MNNQEIVPKLKLSFYLKNAGSLIGMKRTNRKKIEKIIASTRPLQTALIPTFEGTGGPMEEGMIYLLFNAQDGSWPIDSVFRVFWVNSPEIDFSFIDSFLVSSQLSSGRWERKYQHGIFEHLSRDRYHQEVHLDQYEMVFDGTWKDGYELMFNDRVNDLSGKLSYRSLHPEGVITYYNGQTVMTPSMVQRFYDMFSLKVTGELIAQGRKLQLINGRGIIEHGLGIFSGFNIHLWRWLDLQLDEGSVHLFHHPITLGKEGIVDAGEGAAVLNGKWYHFTPGEFRIEELAYTRDENLPIKIPVEWRVTAGQATSGEPLLDLHLTKKAALSWGGNIGPMDEYITNYVLEAHGSWQGSPVTGHGTMENLMHQRVEQTP